jgi:hypothetical protein
MKRIKTLGTLLISLLFAAAPLFAAGARQGWTKVELSAVDGRSAIETAGLLQKVGGELIADYGAYAIIYVPKGIVTALEAQAGKQNLRVRVRDELDVLQLPGAALDAREGISGIALNKLAREYRAGQKAVYVVQFTAPLRAEWMDGLRTIGWELSRYIPNNGYLLVGTPELVEKTRKLAYVQWLDAFHPYQKAFQRSAGGAADAYVFALPAGNASEPVVDEIRRHAPEGVEVERGSLDTYVFGRVTAAAAEELLQNELILSATLAGTSELSDERQVHTLSTLLNPAQTQPVQGDYWNWVLSRCPDCASMPAATWKIGISDSGLDNGAQFGGHPDLAGRKFFGILGYDTTAFANESQCPPGQLLCDAYRHGTLVAGMAAGNGATGIRDSGNYLMGLGGAPTAGIFSTKMFTATDGASFTNANLFKWTKDATNNDVTIQNHSWETSGNNGRYTDLSRRIDIAARDSDDSETSARRPLLMTFAAGNDFGQTGQETSPAGMAKNVLTVGGLENYRPEANQFTCSDGVSGHFTRADSFFNIMSASRVGTNLPGYVKPDVMAPASMIVSTQTSIFQPDPAFGTPTAYCLTHYEGQIQYSGHSGTSFSAPLGAAAALIVKRYLGSTPDATSPALTKAVLIAGTRSVRGGEDRTKLPAQTIGAIPSQQQGFGRLTLEDILNGSQKPVVFDQSPARTFTTSGQTFSTTVRVRDASKPVKIALVWTDAPATAFATNPLVNDLNLEVRRSSDSSLVHIGNKLTVAAEARGEESIAFPAGSLPYDNVNNVEYFRLFVNPNEDLTITVKAWNIAGDTNGVAGAEQDFALAILNAGPACVPGVITQQPLSQTIIPGQTATVSVGVTGTGPFNYQWYQAPSGQFVNPVGIGQVSYTSFPLSQSTQYWAHVTDTCVGAFLNSNAAVITVQCTAPPSITTQPVGSTINPGQSVTLSVGASQAQTYQWYSGTSPGTMAPIAGATAPTLTVSPASTLLYSVRVSNGCGVANSNTVTICVLPAITAQPTSRTINPGQSTTLTVGANNATTYQWYVGVAPSVVTPIGGNSSSLTVTPAATTSYWVRVSNACGLVNSTTATVTVAPVPPAGITRIQSNFALANSQNSITAGWPQPTQAGTFLVAVISADKDSNPVINWTAPAGWIQANTYEWNHDKASVYYLPNNAGGRTSETFTVSPGFHDQTLYLLEYSGVLASGALDRTAINGDFTNNGYLQTGFTANTTQAKELVITVLSTYAVTSFTTTPADGYTEVYDKTIGYHLTTAIYEKIATSIASYGHGANVGVSDEWVGLVVTFKAANP